MTGLLLTGARLVRVGEAGVPDRPVDLRLRDGRVVEVGARVAREPGEEVVALDGRWAMPGLWDAHVHPVMWGLARTRIDLAGTGDPQDVCRRVATALTSRPGTGLVLGYGYRSGVWARQPTVAELDTVTGSRPVALASGDGHNGWLNSAALALVGEPPRDGTLVEEAWYAAYRRLESVAAQTEDAEAAVRAALDEAAARGVVGIVDFEFGSAFRDWPGRIARAEPPVRVRAATYSDGLDEVAARGLRQGDRLVPGCDRVTMGPVKVISDGSLNTMTAWCCDPFVGAHEREFPRGRPNVTTTDLAAIMLRAKEIGLGAAIHAIGDAAFMSALEAFAASGASGSIEHAQLIDRAAIPLMVRLGLTASVQPVHLLDDREANALLWPDRTDRVYAFRTLLDAGVRLALGSDAPVAPLDPWAAIAAAVCRADPGGPPWHPEQRLTIAEALAASTDFRTSLAAGSLADITILDHDPYAALRLPEADRATWLRGIRTAATVVGGRLTYADLGPRP